MPIPKTKNQTSTSHGVSIRVGGTAVGMIQSWVPSQSRTVTPVYELKPDTSGEVIDNVPGNIGGLTITVNRFDLYKSKMEEAFGTVDMRMLTDQKTALSIKEKWAYPDATSEVWVYTGCWFTSLGRNLSATGDRIINVNAALMYIKRTKLS